MSSKPDPLEVSIAATTLAVDAELRELGVAVDGMGGSLLILEGPPATDRFRGEGPPFHRLKVVAAGRGLGHAALVDTAGRLGWAPANDEEGRIELAKDRFRLVVFAGQGRPPQAPGLFWSRLLDAAWTGSSLARIGIAAPSVPHLGVYQAIGCDGIGVDALEARQDLEICVRAPGGGLAVAAAAASVGAPPEVLTAIEVAAKGGAWQSPMPEPEATLEGEVSRPRRVRFKGLGLDVSEGVFAPTKFTVALTDICLEAMGGLKDPVVVDVGTGSGAIALSVANERPDATVHATDSSPAAAHAASRNRDRLGLTNVHCHVGFLLDPVRETQLKGAAVVVSNVPFISPVVPHDPAEGPREAFVGAGSDGLLMARALAADASEILAEGGDLMIQIGPWQLERATELFRDCGLDPVENVSLGKDATVLRGRRVKTRTGSSK